MAVLVHWDKLSLAWLDCGDKFSSDLATVLCSIWNNIMRNVDLAHLECKECATVSLSDLLLHKVPRQDWYIITPRRTLLTAFTDNYFTIVAGNDTFAVKFQPSAQRERSRTMHLPSILTTLPLLYLSTCVVARPTIEPLFWSEDLDEVVNQLRKHGMAETEIVKRFPRHIAVPRQSRPISPFQPFLSIRPSDAYVPTTFPEVDLYDLEDIASMTNGHGAGLFQRLEECLRGLLGRMFAVDAEKEEGSDESTDAAGEENDEGEEKEEPKTKWLNGRRLMHDIDLQGTVGLRGGQMGKAE
ncbi:MAG: hypothetical protein OHK93_003564 [Ramalina farinacea]|uniref:Uncharacterized protein n=1 Tax=Ramalina farinacea TaxID=258253 RepID=A0AA43QTG3_9LECA|nr:hypothetical protein [Ramalina farinacea]